MSAPSRLQLLRTGFSPNFWIANTLELFERLAFYGMKAVLTVFLATKVGLVEEAGTLAGIFSGVVYLLPILAGVLVDKYGFRKTLMACFAMFSVGYFLIALAGMEWGESIVAVMGRKPYVITVLLLTAIGGSLIKPCIVGTVARTTNADTKTLGFSIYYSLVNFGGAIGPIIALFIRQDLGIEYVLIMSSITTFLLFIGTFIFFKEPAGASTEATRTFGGVFKDMLLVFSNFKFILFLVIFSSFWIMFWQIFYLLPFYATDVIHFEQFEILESVDAWCIIFFSLFMSAVFQKWKPFTAMIVGFTIASLSWIIIGVFGTTTAVVLGVALFAVGEGTQAPRFYEYVGSIAPPAQVGTYMGFAFLPVAIGSFGAGAVADWLRLNYLHTNPSMMWFILFFIGAGSTIVLVIYDRLLSPKQQAS
jgi:POT family proton-dependent oligopeptide transporter